MSVVVQGLVSILEFDFHFPPAAVAFDVKPIWPGSVSACACGLPSGGLVGLLRGITAPLGKAQQRWKLDPRRQAGFLIVPQIS